MSEWKETIEEGQSFFLNEELGSGIQKVTDGVYVAMLPKVVKLGPFETLEQAKEAVANNKESIDKLLDNFNQELLELSKDIKK